MIVRRTAAFVLAVLLPVSAAAQTGATLAPAPATTETLTLDEALQIARRNSPALRQSANQLVPASVSLKSARAQILPTLSASGSAGYTGAGQSQFGAFFARTSPFITSGFQLGFQWQFDGTTLNEPKRAKADLAAARADLSAAEINILTDVTTQYISALQAQAQVGVARTQVERNSEFLALAQARYRVGQANLLDVKQAEVARGNSEVALLNAEQRAAEAKLELFRRMGVSPPESVQAVGLTDGFTVTEPAWSRVDLTRSAEEANPQLVALRARERSAAAGVRSAKSAYFPQISAQAGWSGFTQQFTDTRVLLANATNSAVGQFQQCPFTNTAIGLGVQPGPLRDCSAGNFGLDAGGTALTAAQQAAIRDRNSVFPFNFTAQPFQASLFIRLPLWDNFSRDVRIAQAHAQQLNADEQVRGRSLQLQADVASRLLAVQTAYKTTQVQARNRDAARDQQQLAQDRYRVGSGSSLEVTDAQAAVARAEGDYVNAVYNYHLAVTALELAVGRPLR